jgi:hypothetical protein
MYHGISGTKLSRPLGEMTSEHEITTQLPQQKFINPEDLEGAALITAPGDRTAGGSRLVKVNDTELTNPTQMQAGKSFMYGEAATGPDKAIWASAPEVIMSMSNKAKAASEAGLEPYLNYHAMSHTSGDYSHHMADTLLDMLRQSNVKKDVIKDFDTQMRQNTANKWAPYTDWPGIKSPNIEEYLYNEGPAKSRTKMAELMRQGQFQNAGMPDVAAARFATNDPSLLHVPDYSSGIAIGKLDPNGRIINNPIIPHKTYKAQIAADPNVGYVGGFEHEIPFDIMHKEWIDKMKAENPGKYDNPSQLAYTFRMHNPTVNMTPVVVDRLSTFLDLKKRGLIP